MLLNSYLKDFCDLRGLFLMRAKLLTKFAENLKGGGFSQAINRLTWQKEHHRLGP